MSFKTIIIGFVLIYSGYTIAEAKQELTPEQKAERREALIARVGGLVPRQGTPLGRIAFINAQKKIPIDELKDTFANNSSKVKANPRNIYIIHFFRNIIQPEHK